MDDYRSGIKTVSRTATVVTDAQDTRAYRENYEALKDLFLELWEKTGGRSPSPFFYQVKRDLRNMGTNLIEATKNGRR